MRRYDPRRAPNASEWLSLDEGERTEMVKRYHDKHGGYGESLDMHATVHAVVESQLADKVGPVKEAYLRLRKEGLGRHDTIHAIGSVLTEYIWEVISEADEGDVNEEYFSRLSKLTRDSWYAAYDEEA